MAALFGILCGTPPWLSTWRRSLRTWNGHSGIACDDRPVVVNLWEELGIRRLK